MHRPERFLTPDGQTALDQSNEGNPAVRDDFSDQFLATFETLVAKRKSGLLDDGRQQRQEMLAMLVSEVLGTAVGSGSDHWAIS